MGDLRRSAARFSVILAAVLAASPGCGGGGSGPEQDGGAPVDAGADAFRPPVDASDPCRSVGYVFDGESDCDVVRCPELTCECPPEVLPDGGATGSIGGTVTSSECVPGKGCLERVDCNRVCDAELQLVRDACESRIAGAGSRRCTDDADCISSECRTESLGAVCVDELPCADDGHCAAGSICLFDPSRLDPETGEPTTVGTCSDGSAGSRCHEDDHCAHGRCSGSRCSGGLEGESCESDDHCVGFCRVAPSSTSGTCTDGEPGSACYDEGDCGEGLYCASGTCSSGELGDACEAGEQCVSGICSAGWCRSGRLGSHCEEDAHCNDGYCVGSRCASGMLLAPCSDSDDCEGALYCIGRLCSDGSDGFPCSRDEDCTAYACVNARCRDGTNGAECESPDDCMSGFCANPAGIERGECTSGEPGSVCDFGGDCISGDCEGGTCN